MRGAKDTSRNSTDVDEDGFCLLWIVFEERPRVYDDPSATPDDLREAINTLEEIEPTARRVLGGAHPLVGGIEGSLRHAQFLLRAREAPPTSA